MNGDGHVHDARDWPRADPAAQPGLEGDAWHDLRRHTRALESSAAPGAALAAGKARSQSGSGRRTAASDKLHFPPVRLPDAEAACAPAGWEHRALLVSQLRVLLRLRSVDERRLVLYELGNAALADIARDMREGAASRAEPVQSEPCGLPCAYSQLDLAARVRANMRLRRVDDSGQDLDLWSVDALKQCLVEDLKLGGLS